MALKNILSFIPEVKKPSEKKLDFKTKLKWTMLVLACFFILYNIPLHGLSANALERFEFLATVLGTNFGSIISLGIGPIVTSSIILQLLVGSGIININTKTPEGKRYFQGLQKLGIIFFIFFEAIIYVVMQGLQAVPGFEIIVIAQLILGGFTIMFLDEVSSKWGFGSGVSLFILAGVALELFIGLFGFIGPQGNNCLVGFGEVGNGCVGRVLVIIQSVIAQNPSQMILAGVAILTTVIVFITVVWAQSLKVEVPLSYDRLRGFGVKWPLQFFYASVLPVILVSALVANIQLFGGLLENSLGRPTILGGFSNGVPVSGLAYWLSSSNLVESLITGSFTTAQIIQSVTHLLFYMIFATIFSVFWIKTSGMDAASQAKNIMNSGLQIPGFRKDERILESILSRYIMPLTVMGGLAIGALSALANTLGALSSGTAILLAVMISYQFYQNIAQQHAMDMHPALRKMMG